MNPVREIYKSVFRRDPLSTDKGKAELVFHNLWLHIHPAKVHRDHFSLKHTGYLGFISFYLFLILIVTGVALMFYYRPSPTLAYQDMKDIQFAVYLGRFVRNMHRWAAHAMVLIVFLHMCRVFYTGSYKRPRQFNWVIGVGLLLLTLGLSFTGYLLPWDQLSFWAITVGTNIGSYVPIVGGKLKQLLLGGHIVGQSALLRFYVLHVVVLPLFAGVLIMVHFWRIRKDGGLSRPLWKLRSKPAEESISFSSDAGGASAVPVTVTPGASVVTSTGADKTYGLMEVVSGKPLFDTLGSEEEEEEVFSYPFAFYREAVAFLLTLAGTMAVSLMWNAPLEEIANQAKTPNPAKAPWYFLGLEELVSHSALIGGVVLPFLAVLTLLAVPYIDTNPSRRLSERKWGVWIFTVFVIANVVLILIGEFFRGESWAWTLPWTHGG